MPDGRYSDMVNLVRAKDAALSSAVVERALTRALEKSCRPPRTNTAPRYRGATTSVRPLSKRNASGVPTLMTDASADALAHHSALKNHQTVYPDWGGRIIR
jgi:hypothetical protein